MEWFFKFIFCDSNTKKGLIEIEIEIFQWIDKCRDTMEIYWDYKKLSDKEIKINEKN